MSNEPQEAANVDTTAVKAEEEEAKGGEPPAKKKRGADHQITKDDYEDEDEEDSENNNDKLKQGFKRASDEVISKRKIYKVSRNFGAPKPAATTTVTDKTTAPAPASGSKNPFASTKFASSSSTDTTKKVFGFGSTSGFGAATSGSSTGNGFGNGSSGFGSGGGFAGVGTSGKSSGFGSSSGNGSTSGFVFGSSKSTSANGGSSLFGNPGSSGITFSFSKKPDKDGKEEDDNFQATKLPDSVDLKTGEEDEEEVHSMRCKSFEWVVEKSSDGTKTDGNDDSDGKSSPTKANLSVQSSTQFQTAISSSKSNGEKDSETKPEKDTTTENGTSGPNASATTVKHRWMELGIGPAKILRSKSDPGRVRLVQRRESSKNGPATKVILNIPLYRESTCTRDREAPKYLRMKTMKEGKMCQYSLKFREPSEAGTFRHHLTDLIPQARTCFGGTAAEKTTSEPAK